MINGKIIAAFIIHLILTFLVFLDPQYPEIGFILIPFLIGNLIGLILIVSNKVVAGAKVFLISSCFFIPIGVIGILGARQIIDTIKRKEFATL